MQTMKFKNDKRLRDQLYTPDSYQHPAKGHLGLWQEIINLYTKEGDWVLDPMAGVGSTLIAALMGRNVVCVELEQHFLLPMVRSWAKMRQHPMLGYSLGQVVILRGDARCLPLPDASVGAAITSPPYEGMEQHDSRSQDPEAIAKRAELFGKASGQNFNTPGRLRTIARAYGGYTRPVDAVVSSPPYQMANPGLEGGSHPAERQYNHDIRYAPQEAPNIGNLRGDAYWSAMRQVYAECWRVLRPGGVMALVLKGFTRDGQYVDLPQQTADLVQSLGFVEFDRWRRELWSLSFWRILQKRRDPAAFDDRLNFEYVLSFRKP